MWQGIVQGEIWDGDVCVHGRAFTWDRSFCVIGSEQTDIRQGRFDPLWEMDVLKSPWKYQSYDVLRPNYWLPAENGSNMQWNVHWFQPAEKQLLLQVSTEAVNSLSTIVGSLPKLAAKPESWTNVTVGLFVSFTVHFSSPSPHHRQTNINNNDSLSNCT